MGFLSCSNDESIKLWTLEGELINQLLGHNSFVFSVKSFEIANYISGSDDKSIKIWDNDKCIQTIPHPNTIWSVALNQENKDIITACADGIVRVFSINPARIGNKFNLTKILHNNVFFK